MPKILARDPAWLATGTPAFDLFHAAKESKHTGPAPAKYEGAQRNIAHRGTELFVAVGSELRWSEVGLLKDAAEDARRGAKSEGSGSGYRVLRTPVVRPITQLSISPSGDYLAILTTHTCHVCILPSASSLRPGDTPLKLKSFQLGPTAHVLEQSHLVCALWHPLAPAGDVLVTVTHDACVRLWELDSQNRASFDEPALAVDLKKLANATSTQSDFRASKYGTNRGFSPDDVEMQVAAACFGGQGNDDEYGWASMTIWVAMTEGDVYALCPFLPSRWRAPGVLLGSLSTSVIENGQALQGDPDLTERQKRISDQQASWLADVDSQDPILYPGANEFETVEVYKRPDVKLSPIPKLQGPFSISPEPDFGEITDIHVIAPKIDDDALYDKSYGEESPEGEGLSVGIVCLATSTNDVHICLDIQGVEAEWLPTKRSRAFALDETDDPGELLLYETIDLARSEANDNGYPTFTCSPADRYEIFVTHPLGVASVDFRPWIGLLEDELSNPSGSGVGVRLDVFMRTANTNVELLVNMDHASECVLDTAVAIFDPALGYNVITAANHAPFAATLDTLLDGQAHPFEPDDAPNTTLALPAPEPRAPYRPDPLFYQQSNLPQLTKRVAERREFGPSTDIKAPVRFSSETLKIFTEAHRIMSEETYNLGLAAADLFRRCERMRSELQEQIRKVAEVASKVDSVIGAEEGEDDDENEAMTGKEKIEHRIEIAKERNVQLNQQAERLRRKMGRLRGKDLSTKEVAFAREVERLARSILPQESGEDADPSVSLANRFDAVASLKETLAHQVDETTKSVAGQDGDVGDKMDSKSTNVGSDYRKQKLRQVMVLLERETALVEAVMGRLQRLQKA